uniref:Uncharacterized protein n=1 Tax=Arion vulgaris TaxID=1028688 RepID=A0A0B7BVV9_9EUPU
MDACNQTCGSDEDEDVPNSPCSFMKEKRRNYIVETDLLTNKPRVFETPCRGGCGGAPPKEEECPITVTSCCPPMANSCCGQDSIGACSPPKCCPPPPGPPSLFNDHCQ